MLAMLCPEVGAADRTKLLHQFEQLKQQSADRAATHGVTKDPGVTKDIAEASAKQADDSPRTAIKLWIKQAINVDGQWKPGRPIDMKVHKWQPGEPFYLCVETANPVHLSLFSIQPGTQPQLFSPDRRKPETFQPILPGRVWTSPMIRLENNASPEAMDWIAVRADNRSLNVEPNGKINVDVEVVARVMLARAVRGGEQEEVVAEATATLGPEDKEKILRLSKVIYPTTKTVAVPKMAYADDTSAGQGRQNPDEMCQIAVSPHDVGHGHLLFMK